jgi:hypothetical protein
MKEYLKDIDKQIDELELLKANLGRIYDYTTLKQKGFKCRYVTPAYKQ